MGETVLVVESLALPLAKENGDTEREHRVVSFTTGVSLNRITSFGGASQI